MRIKHHISGLYKKILTPIGVLAFFVVGAVFVYAINTWNSGYRVYHNNTFVSVQGGNNGAVSRLIKSTCTVGDSIFIPTSGYAEWDGPNGFLNKKPSCVTLGCRTNSECGGGDTCSGYVAPTCNGTYTPSGTQKYCKMEYSYREGGQLCYPQSNFADSTIINYGNACSSISDCSSEYEFGTNDYTPGGGLCDWTYTVTPLACEGTTVNQCSAFTSQSACTPSGCTWGVPGGGGHCEGTLPDGTDCEQEYDNESDCNSSEWQCSWEDGFVPEVMGQCVVCDANVWSSWSACSATCGGGTQTATNQCGTVSSQSCNSNPCGVPVLSTISLALKYTCAQGYQNSLPYPEPPQGYTTIFRPYSTLGCSIGGDLSYVTIARKDTYTMRPVGSTCLVSDNLFEVHGGYSQNKFEFGFPYWTGVVMPDGSCVYPGNPEWLTRSLKRFPTSLSPDTYHNIDLTVY